MNKKHGFKLLITAIAVSSILLSCGSNKTTNSKAQAVTKNTQAQGNNLETYFTRKDGNLNKIVIKEINASQKNLNIAIYDLTKEDIANSILEAKKRGIDVKIITDKENSKSKLEKPILDKFKANNIPVKINTHAGLMHLKVSIIDGKTVTGGSYNYTESATKNNDENLIVIRDPSVVKEYSDEFNSMWNNTTDYTSY